MFLTHHAAGIYDGKVFADRTYIRRHVGPHALVVERLGPRETASVIAGRYGRYTIAATFQFRLNEIAGAEHSNTAAEVVDNRSPGIATVEHYFGRVRHGAALVKRNDVGGHHLRDFQVM